MKENRNRMKKMLLSISMVFVLIFTNMQINVFAEDSNVVQAITEWDKVQELIDNASRGGTIDLTELQLTEANTTLVISKDITIKCEPTDKEVSFVRIKNLFFELSNNATLTLENISIENLKLNKSVISGKGNAIISKSRIYASTANGSEQASNPPATIDVEGDVTVMTDAGLFSSEVSGPSILDKGDAQTDKAGPGIKAINVTVKGGLIVGGASFKPNCGSGEAIVASGNVTINGVRNGEESNAKVQAGTIGDGLSNAIPGAAIRFTEDSENQRVLSIHGANVFGTDGNQGNIAPYTIKMSEKDIAIVDNSKIGWYTDVPVFSGGFFCITNKVATWGTLDNATEVYPVLVISGLVSGTIAIEGEDDPAHYAPKNETITITARKPATNKEFMQWSVVSGGVIFADPLSTTTTFIMPANSVKISASYQLKHVHTASTTWSKDATNHWHECTANDGGKVDLVAHTYGEWIIDTPATDDTEGSKHRDCVCGQKEVVSIPKLPSNIIVDENTGIKIENTDGSLFESNISLAITPKTEEELKKYQDDINKIAKGSSIANLYDIKLLKDGVEIQPSGELKITLTLTGDAKNRSDLQVVYIDDSNEITIIPSQLIDGKLVFITDHFSYYGVIGKVKTANPSNPNSPQTGDTSSAMLYLGLILISGGIVVYCLKKKKELNK